MKRAAGVLAVALMSSLAGCSAVSNGDAPGRTRCSVLPEYEAALASPPRAHVPPDELRVPVVIHIMERGPDRLVQRRAWPSDAVGRVFASDGQHSVNDVWASARIRFDVVRVEECFFTPPPPLWAACGGANLPRECVRVLGPQDPPLPYPLSADDLLNPRARGLLEVNRWYGIPRAVNVYMWWIYEGDATGWGESPRRREAAVAEKLGIQDVGVVNLSTVWLDEACSGTTPERCQRHVAHELGHALGLSHSCFQSAPEGPPALSVCGVPIEQCSSKHDRMLMRTGVRKGRELCGAEIASARRAARDFF